MNSKELNLLLIENFPNLSNKYKTVVEWQEFDNTGSHVVYGDVFTPYFIECIEQKNETEIIKILNFLEKILEFNDKYSYEVVAFSVIEGIYYEYKDCPLINKYLGNLTRKVFNDVKKYFI